MTGTSLARDKGGQPIQGALGFMPGSHSATGPGSWVVTSPGVAGPFDKDTNVISIYCSTDIQIELGTDNTASADANSHFIPGSKLTEPYLINLGGPGGIRYTYLSTFGSGTVHISERR